MEFRERVRDLNFHRNRDTSSRITKGNVEKMYLEADEWYMNLFAFVFHAFEGDL